MPNGTLKRALLVVAACALLLVGTPAYAQYGPPEGCPPQDPPPENPPPCHPRRRANVSDHSVQPGQTVVVSVPAGTFDPGSDVTASMTRVRSGSPNHSVGAGKADGDGSAEIDALIPDAPRGVYLIWLSGEDANGNPITALAAVVLVPEAAATGVAEPTAFDGPVPPAVTEVQQSFPRAAEPSTVAAVQSGATPSIDDSGRLSVRGATAVRAASLSGTGTNIEYPLTVAAVLILVGTGLVLRRRAGASR